MRVPNTIMVEGKRKVCRIFALEPDTFVDRYTVAFKGYRLPHYGMVYPYLTGSEVGVHHAPLRHGVPLPRCQ